ncbi:carbohydrate ABC transporter permease [Lachnoclostridium sp. Marseille-P6806]|uniref:carbohydrate ABC transporter permease n=1 Tax=Lachnoclostridium sp. Marseille-P6806 TaxID=2364793 RepID=UPI0010301F75|nr:carbohydrate ABC transporter permease [Lachnoclostridium sp. Marseille-P6806]
MKRWLKKSAEDKILDTINYIFCAVLIFVTVYPFYYIFIISLNEGLDASFGGIYWFPRKFTLGNYRDFFSDIKWLRGLGISVSATALGTLVSVLFTVLVAYALSFRELVHRKLYMTIIIVCMYFSGGIIPYYALLKALGLINHYLVYIIPGALNIFFILIGITFFEDIPGSLRESAMMDGAGELKVFSRIILPISKPFLATCILFIGVGKWNNWYDCTFFVQSKALRNLAYLMMQVINSTQVSATSAMAGASSSNTTTLSVQTAAMVVAALPILCIYPFLQKYFVTGMMVGSVKG